jgi:hypothetical protein
MLSQRGGAHVQERNTKKRQQRQPGPKAHPDAQAPTGIGAAAVKGAMQSAHEHEGEIRADDRPVQQDDDQEWRRAGGKSPG